MTLTEAQEAANKAIADFKAENEKALLAKADKGYVDSEIGAQVDKAQRAMFARVDELNKLMTDSVEALESRIDEIRLTGGQGGAAAEGLTDKDVKLFANITGRRTELDALVQYKAAVESYLRVGSENVSPEIRAQLSVGSNPQGGYWVSPDQTGRLVEKIFESSPMRQHADVVTLSQSDALEGPYEDDEAETGWVGETQARPETGTPTVGEWRIAVFEQYANPRATQKVLDDAGFDVEGWLNRKVGRKLIRTENTAFLLGDGVKKPRGWLTYPTVVTGDAARPRGQIQHVVSGANGAFLADPNGLDPFITMLGQLKTVYRDGSIWVMNRATMAAAMKLKDSNGNYQWAPDVTGNAFRFTLFGIPVVEMEDMPDVAADSLSVALAQMQETYTIVDRQGVNILRDPFTDKPYIRFYTTKRVGGDVLNFESIKLMKFST